MIRSAPTAEFHTAPVVVGAAAVVGLRVAVAGDRGTAMSSDSARVGDSEAPLEAAVNTALVAVMAARTVGEPRVGVPLEVLAESERSAPGQAVGPAVESVEVERPAAGVARPELGQFR